MNTLINHQIEALILARDLRIANDAIFDDLCAGTEVDTSALKQAQSALLDKIRIDYLPTRKRVYDKLRQHSGNHVQSRPTAWIDFAFVTSPSLVADATSWGINLRPVITAADITAACKAWAHKLSIYMRDDYIAEIAAHMLEDGGKYWSLV